MKIGLYTGSFDPFTNGHLHVIRRSLGLFDEVVVGIGVNPRKARRFDTAKMQRAIEQVLAREGLDRVRVISYTGLTVDAAERCGASCLIRGIRNGMDYEYEENLASINEEISGLDTIYIRAGSMGNISSSMVMELSSNGRDVSNYLPEEVNALLK